MPPSITTAPGSAAARALAGALLIAVSSLQASDYAIMSDVFGAGGGDAHSATYSMTDMVAEPVTGPSRTLEGGMASGFWAIPGSPAVLREHTIHALTGQQVQMGLHDLLTGFFDEDNDAVRVSAVAQLTLRGGTAELFDTTFIAYTPPPNFTGQDSVSYTVIDDGGDISSGTVLIQVFAAGDVAPRLVDGPALARGELLARYSGMPGFTYTVEVSDALASAQWRKLSNIVAPLSGGPFGPGIFEIRAPVTNAPSRFLRIVYPSY